MKTVKLSKEELEEIVFLIKNVPMDEETVALIQKYIDKFNNLIND